MKNRGQAAMEFLMTYGWAILAAIIVIAVLAIYFRPSNLVGQVSVLSPPFTSISQSITGSTETVIIEVKNNGAETVNLNLSTDIIVTVNTPSGGDCVPVLSTSTDPLDVVGYPYPWNPAVTLFLICDLTSGANGLDVLDEGKSFDGDIRFTYKSGSGTLLKTSAGSISGKIDA